MSSYSVCMTSLCQPILLPGHFVPIPFTEIGVEANIVGATRPSTKSHFSCRLQQVSNEGGCIRGNVSKKVQWDRSVHSSGKGRCWGGAAVEEVEERSIAPPVSGRGQVSGTDHLWCTVVLFQSLPIEAGVNTHPLALVGEFHMAMLVKQNVFRIKVFDQDLSVVETC